MRTTARIQKNFLLKLLPALLLVIIILTYLAYSFDQERVRKQQLKQLTQAAYLISEALDSTTVKHIAAYPDSEVVFKRLSLRLKGFRDRLNLSEGAITILNEQNTMTQIVVSTEAGKKRGSSFDLWNEMRLAIQADSVTTRLIRENDREQMAAIAPLSGKRFGNGCIVMLERPVPNKLTTIADHARLPVLSAILFLPIAWLLMFLQMRRLKSGMSFIEANLDRINEGKNLLRSETQGFYLEEMEQPLKKLEKLVEQNRDRELKRERIQKQISELLKTVNAAAEGDFTVSAGVTADTLGVLGDSFNIMISDLSELIRDTKEAAEQVASSTGTILKNVETMSEGAFNQAEQTQNISNFAKEMAELINNTNANAQRAADAAAEAKQVARRGSEVIEQSINGMQQIQQSVQDASKQVKLLGEHSKRIGEITNFIGEIASKTNLLALNASIEAARAGQSEEGFALVADEIRKLARRSSSSAGEIVEIIADIRKSISRSMEAMENGRFAVSEGTQLVDEAGLALKEILERVDTSARASVDISDATQQQTRYSADIVKSLEHIADIAQKTADNAQQSKQSAEHLEQLSENLNNTVKKFRLAQ